MVKLEGLNRVRLGVGAIIVADVNIDSRPDTLEGLHANEG